MAESTDIRLPRDYTPVFPDRCVVCDSEKPAGTTTIITSSIGWWTILLFAFGSLVVVRAPACPRCGWKLHCLAWLDKVVVIVIAMITVFFVWPAVQDSVPPQLHRWAKMGLAIACLLPAAFYRVMHVHAFEVTAYSKSIEYEFASPEYAEEFAELNRLD